MERTDNDSWDLASSVGATATGVAASRALASQGPGPPRTDRAPTARETCAPARIVAVELSFDLKWDSGV
jgi:O-methyltransferase involved in polyketide biosynthesis